MLKTERRGIHNIQPAEIKWNLMMMNYLDVTPVGCLFILFVGWSVYIPWIVVHLISSFHLYNSKTLMILIFQAFHDSGHPWYTACIKSVNTFSWGVASYSSCNLVGITATVLVMWCMGMVFRCVTALDSTSNEDTQ